MGITTNEPVIIDAIRSGIGRRNGSLSGTRPEELYSRVISALLKRSALPKDRVEDVVTGCVTQIGEQGANIGRIAALLSDLPQQVPGVTLNRMCGSSQQAIHFAAQAIGAGDMDFVIAGGVESMSRVAMFSDIQGGFEKLSPELLKKYEIIHQGESAERIADKFEITREELDQFAAQSHEKAALAAEKGFHQSQITALTVLTQDGKTVTLSNDEGVRPNPDREKMKKLPTIFRPNGKVTAANSSQISDGAAAVLLASEAAAKKLGLRPRAKFRARVAVGGDPTLQLMEIVPATQKALDRAGLTLKDIDLFEVNEAFASVVLAWAKILKVDRARINPNGGAIAHGHPLGATGAVLLTKAVNELERTGGRYALQVMCIGHGMATASILERLN